MALEFDLADLITSRSVNNAEAAVPITDIDAAGGCIVANIVGVIGKLYGLNLLNIVPMRPSMIMRGPIRPLKINY